MNILDYLRIFPNALPNNLIESLLEFKDSQTSPASVSSYDEVIKNDSYRKTEVINLPDELKSLIIKGTEHYHSSYLSKIYNSTIKRVEDPQFLKYNTGYKYDLHNDSEDFRNFVLTRVVNRDITILGYLNEDYEGGLLEFPDYGISIKPKKGTIISFPSYYEFQHRVTPITSGTRYNFVLWIETEKRIYDRLELKERSS